MDIPPSALRLRSVNFLLIAVCEPYPVGLGSPCGFVAARHSPLLHGLFERAYDPLLFAAAVRGETQKRQADLDENTVFAPVAGDLHLVEAVVEHAVHLDPQNRRVVHPVVEQKVEMRAAADEEALLVGQLDVPSDQIVQPVVSVDADGGNRSSSARIPPMSRSAIRSAGDSRFASEANRMAAYSVCCRSIQSQVASIWR